MSRNTHLLYLKNNECYDFLKFIFDIIIANIITAIPAHCIANTCSCKTINARVTESGNSNDDTILPKPKPVCGKPLFNRIGGNTVPNNESINPHV